MSTPLLVWNPFTNNLDYAGQGGSGGPSFPGGVSAWTDVTGTTQLMAVNNGYTADNNSVPVVFSLPTTCAYGKVFRVVGKGTGGWVIQANAGQTIHFGIVDTSSGGTISSNNQYDCIEILCTLQDTGFTVISGPQGDLDYT